MSCYTIAILNLLGRSVQVSTHRPASCFLTSLVYWILWMGDGLFKHFHIFSCFFVLSLLSDDDAILLSARGIQDCLPPCYQMFHSPSHIRSKNELWINSFSWKLKFKNKFIWSWWKSFWIILHATPSNMLWTSSPLLEMCWGPEHAYRHRKERTLGVNVYLCIVTWYTNCPRPPSGAAWRTPGVCRTV